MIQASPIIRTKLMPSRPPRHILPRPRLTQRLLEVRDYRLAIVQGGPGYGKSTALAALADADLPIAWYHLDPEDADPFVFLLHLVHSCRTAVPDLSDAPLARLEEWERNGRAAAWTLVVDTLVNELTRFAASPLLLVLDDVHHLDAASRPIQILDRLISLAPDHLHLILSTRYPLKLPHLVSWRVRGELLEIEQAELAFTTDEINDLFRERYGLALTPEQVDVLAVRIEGWPIALQLVGQRLVSGGEPSLSLPAAVAGLPATDLFAYLAREALAQQPADIQEFLRETAVLRRLSPNLCDCLRQKRDSQEILDYLLENGLFIVNLGSGRMRYHHLFRDLLRQQLSDADARTLHRQAADCYLSLGSQEEAVGRQEEAVTHLLAARAFDEAAYLLDEVGREMVRAGRLGNLANWIGSIPPDILENHPALLDYQGDIARLHSQYDAALAWYQQAERRSRVQGNMRGVSQALRGQARVYLDTVNPSQAEQLLQAALRLSDGTDDRESRARLLDLLAENLLNQGRTDAARTYQAQARELRDQAAGTAELSIRVLLRTGRIHEARRLLEQQAVIEENVPVNRPRMHRETNLLLSLILSFQGEEEFARQQAEAGTERGQLLNSPFTTAVGYMRQGHAWLLPKNGAGYDKARACFEKAVRISQEIGVDRLRVEAYWGLSQAHGFGGDIEPAQQAAQEGIKLAQAAGDEWVAACIRVAMGAGFVLADERDTAARWLAQAAEGFHECSDTHGEAIARLWQCLLWLNTGDSARLARDVDALLRLARQHNYDFLFLRRTLLGPPDPRSLAPLLLAARQGEHAAYVRGLLAQLGLGDLQFHPGYQLRIQTLGAFRLWRGRNEVAAGEWRRKKARQLFQLLLTFRPQKLHRDQIAEMLWPELSPEGAHRDFKIAFSTLTNVLEPNRERNAPSAYVVRDGSRYGLRPEADVWLDAQEFDTLVGRGDAMLNHQPDAALGFYRAALALYQGAFLQEYPYEEWCSEERERLLTLYLRTAERVARALVEQQEWTEAVAVCQLILSRDDCWEEAYRLMMTAYARLDNRTQVARTYQRCVARLQSELGVEPTAVTTQLYKALTN